MDNLFNSRKLFTAAFLIHVLCHGVVHANHRGVPKEVVQPVILDEKKAEQQRGKTICAVLKDDPTCPDLLVCSVYDTKPVHIMSTCATTVDWTTLTRKVWSTTEKKTVTIKYLHLNLIDIYNKYMNAVDLADQLRNCYRFNHWMRNRKWWWSIYLWAIGVGATNAYKLYDEVYERKKAGNRTLPPKLDHLEFIEELIYDFFGWDTTSSASTAIDDSASTAASVSVSVVNPSVARSNTRRGSDYSSSQPNENFYDLTAKEGRQDFFHFNRPEKMIPQRMESNYFSMRWDGKIHPSLPIPTTKYNSYCQYCKYKWTNYVPDAMKQECKYMNDNRKGIERCLTCKVNFCWSCRMEWHGQDIEKVTRKLSA